MYVYFNISVLYIYICIYGKINLSNLLIDLKFGAEDDQIIIE